MNLYIHSFIYHEMHTLWFFPMCCLGHRKFTISFQRLANLIRNSMSCNAFGEFNEGHCVKLQNHLINLRQVSKATMHGQHAEILLPHFVHSKQFMFLVLVKWLFPVTRVQLMSLQRHWHSHHANHAKIWCSLHSHHWALSS